MDLQCRRTEIFKMRTTIGVLVSFAVIGRFKSVLIVKILFGII